MNRDQQISDIAYSLWEQEGRPHGRAAHHWADAEARVTPEHDVKAAAPRKTTKTTVRTVKSITPNSAQDG
jgi:hypothetical protein